MTDLVKFDEMKKEAATLIKSGFFPAQLDTPEKVLAIMVTGKELGLSPMQSVRSIHIVNGKPSMGAELMLALAYRRVPEFKFSIDCDTNRAIAKASRRGGSEVIVTFTMVDANRAGLTEKDVWKKYPRAMLRSRAISELLRQIAPDAISGIYTTEELRSVAGEDLSSEEFADIVAGGSDDYVPVSQDKLTSGEFVKPDSKNVEEGKTDLEAKKEWKNRRGFITYKQWKRLIAIARERQKEFPTVQVFTEMIRPLVRDHGYEGKKPEDITQPDYKVIIEKLEKWEPPLDFKQRAQEASTKEERELYQQLDEHQKFLEKKANE